MQCPVIPQPLKHQSQASAPLLCWVASTALLRDIRDSTWETLPAAGAGGLRVLVRGGAGADGGVVPAALLPTQRPCRCPTCCRPSTWTSRRAGRPGGAPSPPPSTSLSAST